MACSASGSVSDITCYVSYGDHLYPLRLPANTQLIDLGTMLQDTNVLENARDTNTKTSGSRIMIFITGPRTEGRETISKNKGILDYGEPLCERSNSGNITQTVEKHGTIEDLCSLGTDYSDDDQFELSLHGCFLYTYMCFTFQWIEPNETGRRSRKIPAVFYKIMQAGVVLSLWAVMGFEIYNLMNGLPALLANTNTIAASVAVMHRLLWTLRYVILHNVGLCFFHAHRGHISDILNNSNGISENQWQKSQQLIQDLMAVTAFFLLLLPLVQKLIPIFVEQANGIPRNWDMNVEIVEFFVLLYSRVMAMPIFFFLILVVQIHILELENFSTQIQQTNRNITELLKKYKALTKRIQNSSQAFQVYIIALLLLLVLWGTISVYSSVEMFRHVPSSNSFLFGINLSESLGTFVVFVCETILLFSLPFYKLGQVSSKLNRLIFIVATLDCDEQCQRGFTFSSEEKLTLFASLLEKHQKYGNVGFRVAGLQMTQLKSLWFTLLGPVIAFVGNFLLKEHF